MTNKNFLSLGQKIKVADYLKTRVIQRSDGRFEYIKGHSDQEVAKVFGCSRKNVYSIRVEVFPEFVNYSGGHMPTIRAKEMDGRITQIEDYLTRRHPNWRDEMI